MAKGWKMTEDQRKKVSEGHKGIHPKAEFKEGSIPWNKGKKGVMPTPWNKGIRIDREKFPTMGHFKKHSEKSRRKMSNLRKGKLIGEDNPFYGKHHTEETKRKISENKERARRISESLIGKKFSEERKQRMSEITKKRMANPKERKKISEATRKAMANLEIRRLMSELKKGKPSWNKGKHHTKEAREKNRLSHLGTHASEETKRKMSEMRMGHPTSEETKRKIAEAFLGEKSHFWKGGISFEPYPTNWNALLKRAIRQRDNSTCQLCGKIENKVKHAVHHIDYNKKNCNPDNLITLCHNCHSKTNPNREKWKKFFSEKQT